MPQEIGAMVQHVNFMTAPARHFYYPLIKVHRRWQQWRVRLSVPPSGYVAASMPAPDGTRGVRRARCNEKSCAVVSAQEPGRWTGQRNYQSVEPDWRERQLP